MEDFVLVLLVLAVLWLIIRQSKNSFTSQLTDDLRDRVDRFDARLSKLEAAARAAEAPVASATSKPSPVARAARVDVPATEPTFVVRTPAPAVARVVAPVLTQARTAAFPPPPRFVAASPVGPEGSPKRSVSLEERLGQNWLNKLGIVTLVIGVALFLGYQLHNLGPLGKSVIGMALSLALLGGGLLLEKKSQYRIFARAAIGGGWALMFFVTFALYHVDAMKILLSQTADLVLMMLVAAAMVWHSLKYKSQVVTSLAFLLAFVTVGISEVTLFSLVAGVLLAVGLLYVAARERWFALAMCGLVGIYLNHFLWLRRVLPEGAQPGHAFAGFVPSAALLLLYWFLFRLFYILRLPENDREKMVSSLTAILNSVGVMSLLKFQSSHPEWAFWGLLGLGLAEMILAFVARPRNRTAFLVLSTIASAMLVAAIPFRFNGSSWSLLWLLEAEMLFIAGIHLRERVFRRLGILAGFAAALQVAMIEAVPIFTLRQYHTDSTHHISVAVTLITAALVFWFNSEFAPRRWSFVLADDFDRATLTVSSYIAPLLIAIGLWVMFPGAWTMLAWLAACLLLGFVADRLSGTDLAAQADLLALGAVIRATGINLMLSGHAHGVSVRAISIVAASALLYAGMRRKTLPGSVTENYVPAAYSWAAAMLLGALMWFEVAPLGIALAWAGFGLALFEIGGLTKRSFFRHQAYALMGASFVRMAVYNLLDSTSTHHMDSRVYTVVPLIVVYFWVYERLHREQPDSQFSQVFAWLGTAAAGALLYFEVPAGHQSMAWAAMASTLLFLGWALKRTLFLEQSLLALALTFAHAIFFTMMTPSAPGAAMVETRAFNVGATCGILLLSLPIAFAVRRRYLDPPAGTAEWRLFTLYRPEQPFFFVPLVLATVLLAVELRAGMITIGWSALGVLVFLFALTVKQRSYRLAGLGLLMLGVGKILVVDIWNASPSDRYITLIVMGAALLLVSFLYSRYRETLLKFL